MTGGDPSLAAAFVAATGTFGSIFGLTLLTGLKISNPAIRGRDKGNFGKRAVNSQLGIDKNRPGLLYFV